MTKCSRCRDEPIPPKDCECRIVACRLLAGALYDLLYLPETSTGAMLRKQVIRGEAPTKWQECDRCNGDGHDRFRRTCPACEGRGRVKIDPYTGRVVAGEASSAPPRVDRWLCNLCHGRGVQPKRPTERCETCGGEGYREHPPLTTVQPLDLTKGDPATVLENAIEHRDQSGSFHELEACLAILRRQNRDRHRVYWQVAVLHERTITDLDETEQRWLAEADRDLALMMPAEIRVPRYLLQAEKTLREQLRGVRGRGMDGRALRWRDDEIRRRFNAGELTMEQLIARSGLSRSTLYEIVYGESA